MATQAQAKVSAAARSEAFVQEQLAKARFRIRMLDVSAALLGFLALTFLFALVAALADRWTGGLSPLARQLSFAAYLLVSMAYLGITLVWPLLRAVNPYYAARKVEQMLPDAKNSVVNWLDLRGESLPPAFRTAVATRAAKDLAGADIDTAISARRAFVLGGAVAGLFLLVVVQWILSGREFVSHLGRVFNPFGSGMAVTSTELTLVEPAGNLTISVGRAVAFAADVRGRVPSPGRPDAVRVLYRYSEADPWEEKRLDRENSVRWSTQLLAFQVHNGFWYKVAAGDAETDVYRVQVRSTPLIAEIRATYHYRPYVAAADVESLDPNLEALRGTEVALAVRTNRKVREGTLEFIGEQKFLRAERVDGDTLHFRFVIDRDSVYRVWFISTEDERNTEPVSYRIKALQDRPPSVVVTEPGKDTELPANSVLTVEGKAEDDLGVTGMTLRMSVDGQPLPDRPFREGKREKFQLPDKSYLREVVYKDIVELDQLRSAGQPLQEKMVLEYWLEATDACDYPPPGPNRGQSKKFRVTLAKRQLRSEAAKQVEEAKKDKESFDKKQDQDKQRADQQASADKQQPGSEQPGAKNPPEARNDPQKQSPEARRQDEIQKQILKQLQDQDRNAEKGQAKPEKSPPPAETKGEGNKENKNEAGNKNPGKNEQGGNKNPGKNEQGAGQDKQGANKGESKPKPQNAGKAGASKGEGKPEKGSDPQKNKSESKGAGKDQKAGNNNAGQKGKEPSQSKGEGKQGQQPGNKSQGKPEGKQGCAKCQGKGSGNQPKGGGSASSAGKGAKPGNESGAGAAKSGGQGGPKPDAKPGSGASQGQAKGGPSQPQPSGEAKGQGQDKGGASGKGAGKGGGKPGSNGSGGAGGAGQQKAASPTRKPDEIGAGKGEGRFAGDNKDAGNAAASKPTRELIEKLKNGTPAEQKQAEKALEQVKRGAQNQADRDAAAQALKEAGKKGPGQGGKPAAGEDALGKASREIKDLAEKLQGKDKEAAKRAREELERQQRDAKAKVDRDAAAEALKKFGDGQAQPEEGNPGGKDRGQDGPRGNGDPQQGGNDGPKGNREGDPMGKGTNPDKPGNGANPGLGNDHEGNPNGGPAPGQAQAASKPNPRYQNRAGDLLLEKFKDRVTPEMLQKAGISPKEWQDFVRARARAQAERAAAKETLPTRRTQGTGLSNDGPRRSTPTGKRADPLQGGNRSQAPPELRDQLKEFEVRDQLKGQK